ncbi:MAG: peptidoglycan-binding protein [Thermoanaerobaculales bacterium]|jgi:hypothetical protein|nr:peptidoglycan-binding protein [Thermoanaerobaculales bacterium]
MPVNLADIPFRWVRDELTHDEDMTVGRWGHRVRRIQEWLTLNSYAVVIDGKFGPATQFAVECFQKDRGLAVTGAVDSEVFSELTRPLMRVLEAEDPPAASLGEQVVRVANRHLAAGPREVGGANCGPWVRVYMEGHDGAGFLWCAGFACFVVRQAAWETGADLPITPTFSCDLLASSSQTTGTFVPEGDIEDRSVPLADLPPGSLFVQRRTANDWNHTGIVVSTGPELLQTIEGNTNDGGSREGVEVCRRIRGLKSKDYVRIS